MRDLEDGAARGFDPFDEGRDALFVIRRGTALYAWKNACPHQNATMPWKKNAYLSSDQTQIVCSAHGAQFDVESGECLLGAALGLTLHKERVTLGDDGYIYWRRNNG